MPQVIQSFDNSGDVLVVRFPQTGAAAVELGSQLIVQENQTALFCRDGRGLDMFSAGRHGLDTANLPLLREVIGAPWGQSPFQVSVYFFATKTFHGLGWGTSSPITLRDSEYGAVAVRAFGNYSFRVSKPKNLMNTLVGTKGMHRLADYETFFRSIILSRFNKVLAQSLTSILDLPNKLDEVGIDLRRAVSADFDQYGIELVDLLIENASGPPELQARINQSAGDMAIRDVAKRQALAQSDALLAAASNSGGAGAALGAGLGVAMAMGMSSAAQQTAAAPVAAPPSPMEKMASIRVQLEELKKFFDGGLLDEIEYKSAKAELLKKGLA
jgi:membrane protease subunit (stomatin/prohibitin family)